VKPVFSQIHRRTASGGNRAMGARPIVTLNNHTCGINSQAAPILLARGKKWR